MGLGYLLYSCRTVELCIDGSSDQFRTIFFSDCDEGGDSKIVSLPDSSRCVLTYMIGETAPFPFVGCGFSAKDTTKLIDLSQFAKMTLLFDSTSVDTFTLALNFFAPQFSTLSDAASQVSLVRDVVSNCDSLVFQLSDLGNSNLWERLLFFDATDAELRMEKLAAVTFESHERFLRGDLHRIGVTGVVFTGDKDKAIGKALWLQIYSLLPLLFYLLVRFRRLVARVVRGVVHAVHFLYKGINALRS